MNKSILIGMCILFLLPIVIAHDYIPEIYYKFDTNILDSSGKQQHLSGEPTSYASGILDNAGYYDGTDTSINISLNNSLPVDFGGSS